MIGENDVLKIAALCQLRLTDDEKKRFTTNLNSILGYVESLNARNVSNVEAMSHVHGSSNVFREDLEVPAGDPENIFNIVPARSGRFIKVPIIIS